jgi:hypothetical protein
VKEVVCEKVKKTDATSNKQILEKFFFIDLVKCHPPDIKIDTSESFYQLWIHPVRVDSSIFFTASNIHSNNNIPSRLGE